VTTIRLCSEAKFVATGERVDKGQAAAIGA
jgi:hypothetical protein